MIVDCHIHAADRLTGFWQPQRYGRIIDRGRLVQAMPPSFDPSACPAEMALGYMDQAGVDHAILVQHHIYGDQNETITTAARRWPDRFHGFAYLGAMDQADAPDRLERLLQGGLTGLKVELGQTRRQRPGFRLDEEIPWRVWERLDQTHRPLILDLNNASHDDVVLVRRLLDEFSHLWLDICHLGGAPREGWEEKALLGKHPRVWIDLSSLQIPFGPDHEYPFPQAQELIRWAVENIGADKLMWGTDYPGALNWATYRQHVDVVRRHCTFLSADQREEILGKAAMRFLTASF